MNRKTTQRKNSTFISLSIFTFFIMTPFCLLGQAGNTVSFQAGDCGIQDVGSIPHILTYIDTDGTGRHKYEHSANRNRYRTVEWIQCPIQMGVLSSSDWLLLVLA